MKKILGLLLGLSLLTGCAESLALLGPGASNGRIIQSSLNSAISYGVKKQTGKTPLEHAIAYAEEKNPERKKETCISSFKITKSEFCTIVKKQIKLKSTAVIEKTQDIVKEYPKKKIKKSVYLKNFLFGTSSGHNYVFFRVFYVSPLRSHYFPSLRTSWCRF